MLSLRLPACHWSALAGALLLLATSSHIASAATVSASAPLELGGAVKSGSVKVVLGRDTGGRIKSTITASVQFKASPKRVAPIRLALEAQSCRAYWDRVPAGQYQPALPLYNFNSPPRYQALTLTRSRPSVRWTVTPDNPTGSDWSDCVGVLAQLQGSPLYLFDLLAPSLTVTTAGGEHISLPAIP